MSANVICAIFSIRLQSDSFSFFSLSFVFLLGLICQRLTAALNGGNKSRALDIIRSISVGVLILMLVFAFCGVMRFVDLVAGNIQVNPEYPLPVKPLPIRYWYDAVLLFSLFYSVVEAISSYPSKDSTKCESSRRG